MAKRTPCKPVTTPADLREGAPPPGPRKVRANDWIVGMAMAIMPDQHFIAVHLDFQDVAYVQRQIDNLSSLLRRRVRKKRPWVRILVRRSGPSDLAVWCVAKGDK